MVFGKSGHGPHLSSGGAGAVFRALAARPVNGAPVFPGKQNQPALCIPSPLLRILTMFSKKTTEESRMKATGIVRRIDD